MNDHIPALAFLEPESNPIPTSLATSNCQRSKHFDNYNKQIYHTSIQPLKEEDKYVPLNSIGPQFENGFTKNEQGCGFFGSNPLLIDAARGMKVPLDRPNLISSPELNPCESDIYHEKYNNYGQNYKNYNDMNTGNIQYYTYQTDSPTYNSPNFVTPAEVTHVLFQDPNGVIRPEYNRNSHKQYSFDWCKGDSCDSFTHDTLEFRQELMEKQMRKQNESKYESRWFY